MFSIFFTAIFSIDFLRFHFPLLILHIKSNPSFFFIVNFLAFASFFFNHK